jgi:nitrite reductase (NO-forming)
VDVELEAVELAGKLAPETTYAYWTFNGKVPGAFIRIRVGDTVALPFKKRKTSWMIHSVDLQAVTGPGGGAVTTQTPLGEATSFRFKARDPGFYVYHCATPMVANRITSGRYGLTLVEPAGHKFSVEKLLAERPEYFVFNGAIGVDESALLRSDGRGPRDSLHRSLSRGRR